MKLKMRKIWKLVVVALVITTSAFAQQRGQQGGQRGGGKQAPPELPTSKEIKTMVSNLSGELLLSDEQEEQVLELYTLHFEEVENKTKSGRPDRNEMEELKEDFENEVKAVLTEEQQELFTAYLKKNSKKRKSKRKIN
ncbi:hypothetical protein SAMN06265371_102111 [Lutibacter agarilyticus]|uniref:LTXXQ motif family protein n=1 Tax=Lutibacter agarilyticus TaxID=1109740 RepID=A0A238VUL9_9FLAO|nr:hypothetical protein [Lutibacter agarilyticus]SNR37938.1 hypothetical protein SAMN06265371_102111 [Lutibacter agarilyticus]